jgi:uncharacterized protein YaiL (DUF2058 family)
MAISLQEQLLKSGLTNKSKVNKSKKEKYKQSKEQRNSKTTPINEVTLLAQKALAEKQAKDKELNQKKEIIADKKAIIAQINQLIKLNIQAKDDEGTGYNFTDDNKVKTIYVNPHVLKGITQGKLAIVRYANSYEVVPAPIAEKISQRSRYFVVLLNDSVQEAVVAADDPYAKFQIPDDLMW